MRKKNFKSLSSILNEKNIFESSNYHFKRMNRSNNHHGGSLDFIMLIKAWEKIVGPRLSKHTIPLKNTNKILYILTDHSAFSQQLSFMEELIKQKIFQHYPKLRNSIERIFFETNSRYFKQISHTNKINKKEKRQSIPPEYAHSYSPTFRKLKKIAEEKFADIEDEEIRNSLISIYIQDKKEGVES